MHIKSLEISNILSVEHATINFDNSGLVLLEGFNYDDGRANGAGKSAVFNALAFGLYGKCPRKISISDIVRKGAKSAFTSIDITTVKGDWTIRRERPTKVIYTHNGEIVDITQEEFEKTIGLSYSQFITCMYSAQDSDTRFLSMNDSAKKDFLVQLMDLESFKQCKDFVAKTLTELRQSLDIKLRESERSIGELSVYEKNHIKDTNKIETEIASNFAILLETLEKIKKLEAVSKPDISKYIEIENQISHQRADLHELKINRKMLFTEFNKLASIAEQPFIPDANCPHCEKDLIINGATVLKADHKNHDKKVAELKTKMDVLNLEIKNIDKKLVKEADLDAMHEKIKAKMATDTREFNEASNRAYELRQYADNKQALIDKCNTALSDNDDLLVEINNIKNQLDDNKTQMKYLNDEIEINESLSHMFSPTGAQAYIMDATIDSFNEVVDSYIGLIWSNASYRLRSFKENKSGDISAKFSDQLIINGTDRSVGGLSGGEYRALSLAIDFAMTEVLCNNFGISLNPIIMDEPFNALDAAGRELVIEMLEKLSVDRQIWVVDHMNECKGLFSKTFMAEKRSGITKISVI